MLVGNLFLSFRGILVLFASGLTAAPTSENFSVECGSKPKVPYWGQPIVKNYTRLKLGVHQGFCSEHRLRMTFLESLEGFRQRQS